MVDKLQAGTIPVAPGDWATFLYREEDNYDPEDPAQGLFKGYVVLRVSNLQLDFRSAHSFVFLGCKTYIYRPLLRF